MIIPSKFNGFHDGVRRCFGGGGGGGGGGDGTNEVYAPAYGSTPVKANTAVNTGNAGNNAVTQANFDSKAYLAANPDVASELNRGVANFGDAYGHYTRYGMNEGRSLGTAPANTAGTSTIPRDNLNLRNMAGMRYDQSGPQYNALLQQGYTGSDIRNALTTNGKPVSDSDYQFLVQNAAMTSPTSRPFAGSDQFYQPVYNAQYQNYARPVTQFNTSSYGTQPSNSALLNQTSRANVNNTLDKFYQDNYRNNPMGVSMSDTLNFMREKGINRDDFQAAGNINNYGPQMSMPSMQTQMPFNPYTNSSGYGGYMPQMQSPFSYQQPTPQRTSSGPGQAIVGRSSQMRGTPNVMRRAEGGITSLLDQDE
jgi:hypothetical protein